jgi:methyl-accepting chemotaxis protein
LSEDGKLSQAQHVLSAEAGPVFDELQTKLQELDDLSYKGSLRAKDGASVIVQRTTWLICISLPLAFLLSLGLTWFIIRKTSRRLIELARQLHACSNGLSERGTTLSETAVKLSHSTIEEASAVEESSKSLQHVNERVTSSAQLATDTAGGIAKTRECATTGHQSVEQLITAIEQISESNHQVLAHVDENDSRMQGLTEIMRLIAEKTAVINDIVFQTKLLSFNASVEAARAGEQGKGFAVVAEEIANLAKLSGEAAKEINAILEDSSGKVNEIVEITRRHIGDSVREATSRISVGTELSSACASALEQIMNAAESANTLAGQIAHAANEQSVHLQQVTVGISQLSDLTSGNSNLADQTATESKLIIKGVHDLNEIVAALEGEVNGAPVKKAA